MVSDNEGQKRCTRDEYLEACGGFVLNDFTNTFSALAERAQAVEQQAYDRFAANANDIPIRRASRRRRMARAFHFIY